MRFGKRLGAADARRLRPAAAARARSCAGIWPCPVLPRYRYHGGGSTPGISVSWGGGENPENGYNGGGENSVSVSDKDLRSHATRALRSKAGVSGPMRAPPRCPDCCGVVEL